MRLSSVCCLLLVSGMALAQQQNTASDDGEAASQREDREARGLSERRSRTGFTESKPAFGGPTSPEGELEVADRENHPRYVSTLGLALAIPVMCGAPLVGWLIRSVGFEAVFLAGAATIGLSAAQTFRLDEPRHADVI